MKTVTGIAVGIMVAIAWGQSDNELTPRQIFDYGLKSSAPVKPSATPKAAPGPKAKPVDPPAVKKSVEKVPVPVAGTVERPPVKTPDAPVRVERVDYSPLALRYSILQRKGNNFEEVDADTEFRSGDRIRVRVEPNSTAYLYIVMGGSSGQWRVIFPSKEINGGNNLLNKGETCTIPPESDPAFFFDDVAGVEKISLVLSRSKEPDLEKLIYAAGDPTRGDDRPKTMMASSRINGEDMGKVREQLLSRDLVFEKYDGPAQDGKQEKAVYAATRSKNPDARLFVDLKLIHK
jgi:Domain of unknown function (DUF4384)